MTPGSDRISKPHQEMIASTLAKFNPAVIYLFGSFGTDAQHPSSDIDLAFLPLTSVSPLTCFETANELSDALNKPVDLVDLTTATTVMAKEVLRTGIILSVANQSRCSDFEMRTLSDYARLNEERRPVLDSLKPS